MPKKTFTPEQIVGKLRQIEVLMSQGKTVPLACKDAGIVDQTYYRWRKEYGGLQLEQARKLKDLQKENAHIRREGKVGKRWLLLTRWMHLDGRKRQPLNDLFRINRRVMKTYLLKERYLTSAERAV